MRRQTSAGRQAVDRVRQDLRKLVEDLVSREPGTAGKLIDDIGRKRVLHLDRRHVLVGAGLDPGIDGVAKALLLELLDEPAKAVEDAAWRGIGRR